MLTALKNKPDGSSFFSQGWLALFFFCNEDAVVRLTWLHYRHNHHRRETTNDPIFVLMR
jgi:hypothetical protein